MSDQPGPTTHNRSVELSPVVPTGAGRMLVRPYRQYEAVYQHDGPLLGMTWKIGGHPEPDLPALIGSGDEIKRSEIQHWLEKIPCTQDEIEELHSRINLIRTTVFPREAVPETYPYKRVQDALKSLETDLPSVIAEIASFAETSRRRVEIRDLQRFCRAVARIRKYIPDDIPPVHHKFRPWHDDALFLAFKVKELFEKRGTKVSLKSVSSPAIIFVTVALNRASANRERPCTKDRVRQALAAHPWRALLGFG